MTLADRVFASGGDLTLLRQLCIELVQEIAVLRAENGVLQCRRAKDAQRKRTQRSAEIPACPQISAEIPVPPSPSLLPPGPPNNSYPSPASASSSAAPDKITIGGPRDDDPDPEAEFASAYPRAWAALRIFVGTMPVVKRLGWIGRCRMVLEWCTEAELAEAVMEFLTIAPSEQSPAMLRRYVERIQRDAKSKAERAKLPVTVSAPLPSTGKQASGEAEAEWQRVLNLMPQWRSWTAEKHASLPEGTKRGISRIGGFRAIAEAKEYTWIKKEFIAAYTTPD